MDISKEPQQYRHKQLSTVNVVCITVSIIAILASAAIITKRNMPANNNKTHVYSFNMVNGQIQSGATEISAMQGDKMQFLILSNMAGNFHLSGYPVQVNLEKNTVSEISFTVNEAGRFSYEFGPQDTVLGSINIAPQY